MRSEVEEISSTKKRIRIHIPADVVSREMNNAYQQVNQSARVPGFRPGKIPRSVLEKRFGKDVKAQIMERMVPEWYNQAVKEAGVRPVTTPVFESALDLEDGQPFDMTLAVEVRPNVEDLSYEGLQLTAQVTEPTEQEVDRALQAIRRDRGTLEPAEMAETGSHVVFDYEAYEGDTHLESVSDKDLQFDVGSDQLPPEFTKETMGRKPGDRYDVTVTYPQDHPGQDVAGKTVTFKVHLKEIKRRVLAELNDAFAKDAGFESSEVLKDKVVENIRRMKQERAFDIQRREASEKLLGAHEFDLPEALLQTELQHCVEDARRKLGDEGKGKTDDELRSMVREDAVRNVKGRILMEVIGEKEGVTVSEDDMKKKIAEIAAYSGVHIQALLQYYSQNSDALEQVRSHVFETKTFERIIAKATLANAG